MLNLMTVAAPTNIIFNHDADVLLPVKAVVEAVELLRAGNPFVYPYSGAFLRVGREYMPIVKSGLCAEYLGGVQFKGWHDQSVGGSVAFLRDKYFFEDERFISHSPEDVARAKLMGLTYGYKRVEYPLYHLDHWCGKDSGHGNEYVVFNNSEQRRIREIKTKEQAWSYIQEWPWYHEHKRKLGL